MGKQREISPSPLRSAIKHTALSVMVFGSISAVLGTGIQLAGDPQAAGPQLHLALFESTGSQQPVLKARLRNDAGNVDTAALAEEPSLGVTYGDSADESGTQISSLSVAPPTAQGDAPLTVVPGAVRINGKLVRPGQSLSSVSTTEIISLPKVDIASLTEYHNGMRVPRIAADGRAPADVYARPFTNPRGQPTVSLIIGGLGINARHTKSAIEELPPEVTLSFSSEARNLQMWMTRAREAGHEVLLELPMQPYDYGRMRPHPQSLAVENDAGANIARLEKLLSQATGYFGVVNYQGAKLAASEEASRPILSALSKRGLALIEDGSLPRSVFGKIATDQNLRFSNAAHPVDLKRDFESINTQLAELETLALENGAALGTAYAYPVTIDTAREWTGLLAQKGILLAPASTHLMSPPPGSFKTGSRRQSVVNTAG